MPGPDEILGGLSHIATRFLALAVAWHVVALAVLAAVAARRWRPGRRLAAVMLALPLMSVSALAWTTGNPFNGTIFAALAALLAAIGLRLPCEPVSGSPPWAMAIGAATLLYAWLYPHFLDSQHPAMYLIAAPMGLVPCPTLSMVIGFALLARGLGSRAWSLVAASAGTFYGLFGMVRLGVWLDAGLLAASAALLMLSLRLR